MALDAPKYKFFAQYAGWAPGQLERELESNEVSFTLSLSFCGTKWRCPGLATIPPSSLSTPLGLILILPPFRSILPPPTHSPTHSLTDQVWITAACAPELVLKQVIQLPKPLWREVLELMGGEYAIMSKQQYGEL